MLAATSITLNFFIHEINGGVLDKPKTPKEKMSEDAARHRIKKERHQHAPLDDLEQIRRELGWGLIKHNKHDIKKK